MTVRSPLRPLPEAERVRRLAEMGLDENMIPLNATPAEKQAAATVVMEKQMDQKPGNQTSEYKLTLLIIALGTGLDIAGIILGEFSKIGLSFPWMPVVMVIVGSLLALLKALGYTRGRVALKAAELQQKFDALDPALVTQIVNAALTALHMQNKLNAPAPAQPPAQQ